jgi:hypothetical protein
MPPAHFCLSYFSERVSDFACDGLKLWSFYVCLLCSLYCKHEPPCLPGLLLR